MTMRISDRICSAIAGLTLIFLTVAEVLRSLFGIQVLVAVSDAAASVLGRGTVLWKICVCAVCLLLLAVGLHCFLMLFRHNSSSGSFVTQKTESGEMSISIKTLEKLVDQCAERYPEANVEDTKLENLKDSVVVKMKVTMDSGVNIPLTVGSLQHQIKQYVTDCSGIDVKEVRVMVEPSTKNTTRNLPPPPAPEYPPIKPVEQEEPAQEKVPAHQRIFGREEAPAAPVTPEPAAEPAAEPEAEPAAEPAPEPVPEPAEPVAEPAFEAEAETVTDSAEEKAAEAAAEESVDTAEAEPAEKEETTEPEAEKPAAWPVEEPLPEKAKIEVEENA